MKKIFISIIYIANCLQFTFAQNTSDTSKSSFSLKQAVDYALQNQYNIKNAILDERIAKNKINEIIGIGLPQINGNIDAKGFIEIPTTILPDFITPSVIGINQKYFGISPIAPFEQSDGMPVQFGTKYNSTAGIDVSQIVFNSDYLVGLQATRTFLDLAKKATQRTKIETSAIVTKAYYSVLLNEERMKLVEANVARLKKLMNDTRTLNANGFVEKIDLDRIMVAYNNLLVEKEKIQRMMGMGNALLKFQMGMPQTASLTLTDKLADVKLDVTFSADEMNYSNRIEYLLLETQHNAAKLQLKKDKLSYLPNMTLYGTINASAYRQEFDIFDTKKKWYPTELIGAKIGVPIFSGRQKHHRIQQSKLGLIKAENNLEFMQQSIDLEESSAKANLQNASASLETQKKNMVLAEEIYSVAKLKYEQGVGSNLEVMNAETSLKEAQTNYLGALYDALIAKVDYDKATGAIK